MLVTTLKLYLSALRHEDRFLLKTHSYLSNQMLRLCAYPREYPLASQKSIFVPEIYLGLIYFGHLANFAKHSTDALP